MPRIYKTPLSKRTFELVARIVANAISREYYDIQNGAQNLRTARAIALDAADKFSRSNERFDRKRFYRACGLED